MVTVIVNVCWTVFVPSVAASTTAFAPAFDAVGTPDSVAVRLPLSTNVSHAGRVGAVMTIVSSGSRSATVIE